MATTNSWLQLFFSKLALLVLPLKVEVVPLFQYLSLIIVGTKWTSSASKATWPSG